MKIPCEIIQDLLPLYLDGVCSEVSKKTIEEHLQDCEKCKEELRLMGSDIKAPHIQAEDDGEAVKAAAAAWKKGKNKAFLKGCLIVLVAALLVAGLLMHRLIPASVSMEDLQVDGVYQLEHLKWGTSETLTKLIWGKAMEVNPGNLTLASNEQLLYSRQSCEVNGAKADVTFVFSDGGLCQIRMNFKSLEARDWFETLLEEIRVLYGPETQLTETGSGVTFHKWDAGNTQLAVMSPPNAQTADPVLLVVSLMD